MADWIKRFKQRFKVKKVSEEEAVLLERIRKLEQEILEKKPQKLLGDYSSAFELASAVSESKYGVPIASMIQKTAWHYIMSTGGIPKSQHWFDRAIRASTTLDTAFTTVDKLFGEENPFAEMSKVSQIVSDAARFKESIDKISGEKEGFTVKDAKDLVETFLDIRKAVITPQTPEFAFESRKVQKPKFEVEK